MILVDTSVWIDHLRSGDATLLRLLGNSAVLAHPWVTGELALGNLVQREEIIGLMRDLPHATLATDDKVLALIEQAEVEPAERIKRSSGTSIAGPRRVRL